LYQLPSSVSRTSTAVDVSLAAEDASVWRRRLAHLNQRDLAVAHEFVDDIPPTGTDDSCCRPCRLGEAHKLPFQGCLPRATAVGGGTVHSDIMEPLPTSFQDRYRYIVTFVDDYSRYLFVGLVHRQSDLGAAHVAFCRKFVELSKNRVVSVHVDEKCNRDYQAALRDEPVQVCRVHSDGAKEVVALRKELDDATAHTFSPTYTPGLHSIAERVNRTMTDAARTMLIDASLPSTFWPHAVKLVVAVHNRGPHRGTLDAPSCLLTGVRLSVKYVRVLGSTACVLRQSAGGQTAATHRRGSLAGVFGSRRVPCAVGRRRRRFPAHRRVTALHVLTRRASWPPKALML
jgi:hypothetical protein